MKDDLNLSEVPNYDMLIIGGGISGMSLFALASANGKKVLIIDKKDLASGTSQASGMMIWGGLLYLKSLEFGLVRKLSKSRDKMMDICNQVSPRRFHFAYLKNKGRSPLLMKTALGLYRFLGGYRRNKNQNFSNQFIPSSWSKESFCGGISYEEGFLNHSDAQFVNLLQNSKKANCQIETYAILKHAQWEETQNNFSLEYQDQMGETHLARATHVVNAGGIWVDEINTKFGIKTKHQHVWSKGVYLILSNDTHEDKAFVVDMEEHDDTLCWVPWGSVIMWGPTETLVESIDDVFVNQEDVDFLLEKLNQRTLKKYNREDIINVRVGVRPLVWDGKQEVKYGLDLSRKSILEKDKSQNWFSVFGGKFSGAIDFAEYSMKEIFGVSRTSSVDLQFDDIPKTMEFFNGLKIPDPKWCVENLLVHKLEDYLRRRSNVSQWIPREGLGWHNEFEKDLLEIAFIIHRDYKVAQEDVNQYKEEVELRRSKWN